MTPDLTPAGPATQASPAQRTRRVLQAYSAGLLFVFLWFFIGGIAHFALTASEMRIVPPYVPWPRAAVLVSGAFEIAGAMALLWRPTRRLAAWALFALTLVVSPAHFYMLQQPALFPSVPYWALVLRLPVQMALLALIAWLACRPVLRPACGRLTRKPR